MISLLCSNRRLARVLSSGLISPASSTGHYTRPASTTSTRHQPAPPFAASTYQSTHPALLSSVAGVAAAIHPAFDCKPSRLRAARVKPAHQQQPQPTDNTALDCESEMYEYFINPNPTTFRRTAASNLLAWISRAIRVLPGTPHRVSPVWRQPQAASQASNAILPDLDLALDSAFKIHNSSRFSLQSKQVHRLRSSRAACLASPRRPRGHPTTPPSPLPHKQNKNLCDTPSPLVSM